MSKHGNSLDASGHTEATAERPWHRRSRLYEREADIRSLVADGYSLRQIVQRLDLRVSRSALWRFLRRTTAARPAGEVVSPPPADMAPTMPLAAAEVAEATADDVAAEALLSATEFTPPPKRTSRWST